MSNFLRKSKNTAYMYIQYIASVPIEEKWAWEQGYNYLDPIWVYLAGNYEL